jgi:hypothetical protein
MNFELQKMNFQRCVDFFSSKNFRNNSENYNNVVFVDDVCVERDVFADECVFNKNLLSNQDITLNATEIKGNVVALGALTVMNKAYKFYSELYAGSQISLANVIAQTVFSLRGSLALKSSMVLIATAVNRAALEKSVIQNLKITPEAGRLTCSLSLDGNSKIRALTVSSTLPDDCEVADADFFQTEKMVGEKTLSQIFKGLKRLYPKHLKAEYQSVEYAGGLFDIFQGRYICTKKPAVAEEEITLLVRTGLLDCPVEFQNCKGKIQTLSGAIFAGTTNGSIVD